MFAKRHPFLFFSLIFTSIMCATVVFLSLITMFGFSDAELEFGEKVGVIEIEGVITDSVSILEDIRRFRKDDSIKAIVIRINSPGGGVAPSQEIYRELKKTIKTKKVIASLGAIAASGGYYIAAGTSGIMSSPGTITGSIGVIMGFTNIEELFKKIGLSPVIIKSGQYKDIGSPAREMTPDEKELLQSFSDNIHDQFIKDVADGRFLTIEKVKEFADGRILSGEQAKMLGLVDHLGNFQDAVQWAGNLSGIKGDIIIVYPKKNRFLFLEELIEGAIQKFVNAMTSCSLINSSDYILNFSR